MKSSRIYILLFWVVSVICTPIQGQNSLLHFEFAFETKDSVFSDPFIDMDEWRDEPVRHRYVHGGFEGTQTRFSFYFPPEHKYEGRFFQYITPFPDNENLSQGASGEGDKIGFSIASGAYFIETNGGGRTDFSNPRAQDPTIGAYRANAASAQFSRVVAMKIFGGSRPFGYSFGGSGGAYRTVGGLENTEGVWDGAVPYVLGSPVAIPNVFTVRMYAMRVLKDKFPQIVDALEPGGSGDIYAGLNEEEKAVLKEVTKMGFPTGAWYGYNEMGIHGFLVLYPGVVMADQSYFTEDFWNIPGYQGYDKPDSFTGHRIQKQSKIKALIGYEEALKLGLSEAMSDADRGSADLAWKNTGDQGEKPEALQLEDLMPDIQFLGGDLIIKSGDAAGASIQITSIAGDKVGLAPTIPLDILAKLKAGDEVQVDNSNFLAVQTYHRHQDPGKQYPVWNQFRDENANPLYPQRPMLLGPMFTMGAAGSVPNGIFKGKMILLGSLWDREAFPWQCDWYRQRVKEHKGDQTENDFRLWYTEHALHGDMSSQLDDATHAVGYLGVLQQALRDISTWVEKGIPPPSTTSYQIAEGQVVIPSTAKERRGIQPVVNVTVNGSKRADIKMGESITLNAVIEVPENTGTIVSAAWDFDGSGSFKDKVDLTEATIKNKGSYLELTRKYTYSEIGTYFPVLRVASQRNGNLESPYTRIQNLDRVRVVVD